LLCDNYRVGRIQRGANNEPEYAHRNPCCRVGNPCNNLPHAQEGSDHGNVNTAGDDISTIDYSLNFDAPIDYRTINNHPAFDDRTINV